MHSDSIADMIARLRNAQGVGKKSVLFPDSKLKRLILDVLKDEGYILSYEVVEKRPHIRDIVLKIKYHKGSPAIQFIRRCSKPGLRRYTGVKELPLVRNGLGISIVSTSKGVMCDHKSRELGIGGEILCEVY